MAKPFLKKNNNHILKHAKCNLNWKELLGVRGRDGKGGEGRECFPITAMHKCSLSPLYSMGRSHFCPREGKTLSSKVGAPVLTFQEERGRDGWGGLQRIWEMPWSSFYKSMVCLRYDQKELTGFPPRAAL